MDFFLVKTMLWKKCKKLNLVNNYYFEWYWRIHNQISYFYFFRFQRWPYLFVYITTNCSCCPLNCFSVPAESPICRSPNTLPSCSTSTSSSAATTSMSGSQQAGAWPAGQACKLPGLALHLYHWVVGHHPGQLVLWAQQHLLAPQKCSSFLFR